MEAIPTAFPIPQRSAWKTQAQVVWALYIRETKTRFGKYKLGLLWAIVETLGMVAIKSVIFGIFFQRTVPSMPYAIFLMAGLVPFRLFTGLLNGNLGALNSNEGLLIYRQVKPIDPLIARAMFQVLVFFVSVAVFLLVASWFGVIPDFHQPLEILFALLSLLMLSLGLAIFLSMMAHKIKSLEKVVPLTTYPLLFLSCVLHPLSAVPSNYQPYFLWNPLVVIFESIRKGLYQNYPVPDLNLYYPFCLGLVSLAFGLNYYWKNRDQHYFRSNT